MAGGRRLNVAAKARREARLAVVQALYQQDLNPAPTRLLADEFEAHRLEPQVDAEHFRALLLAAGERAADIDEMLNGALAKGWTVAKLEAVLRALLRAGVAELLTFIDIPVRVVIDEYVTLAKGFFEGREPAMVNGVLDALAHRIREAELPARDPVARDPVAREPAA
jgi:N utilization substance protein B